MKQIALAVLLFLGVNTAFAQDDVPMYSSTGKPVRDGKVASRKKTGFDASRIIFGGGFGLGFGNVTNVNVAPVVGYRITDRFSAGVGMGYQYVRVKDGFPGLFDENNNLVNKPKTFNAYAPNVWTRYVLWNNVFAHLEYEHNIITMKRYYNDYSKGTGILSETLKIDAPALLIGGGIRQPVSDRVSILFQAMYDVLQDQNSPYYKTIAFRFGIVAGF